MTTGIRLTPAMRAALVTIAADIRAPGVKGATLEALERRGLIRLEQRKDGNGDATEFGRWYVTDAGRAYLPTTEPAPVADVDPAPRFTVKPVPADGGDAPCWGVWDGALNRFANDYHQDEEMAAWYAEQETRTAEHATVRLVDGIAVHTLGDDYAQTEGSGELAYAYTQTTAAFHDGDVLVVGGTVAVMNKAWPIAVTVDTRELHTLNETIDWTLLDGGRYTDAYRVAVALAEQGGFPVRPNGTDPDERRPVTLDVALQTAETPLFCATCAVRVSEHATERHAKRQEWACELRQDAVTLIPMMPLDGTWEWDEWVSVWLAHSATDNAPDVEAALIPTTVDDIRNQVTRSLGARVLEFDVTGIVDQVNRVYGLVPVDSIPGEAYWDLVARFAVDVPESQDPIVDQVTSLMARRRDQVTALVSRGLVPPTPVASLLDIGTSAPGFLPGTAGAAMVAAKRTDTCQWSLACTNVATGTIAHPILDDVPACDPCAVLSGHTLTAYSNGGA